MENKERVGGWAVAVAGPEDTRLYAATFPDRESAEALIRERYVDSPRLRITQAYPLMPETIEQLGMEIGECDPL